MSLIDHLTPAYYRVLRLGIQRDAGPGWRSGKDKGLMP